MAKPYSEDLHKRVIEHIERGESCRAAASKLDVSASFSIKLKVHDSVNAKAALAKRGAWFLFLPPYALDLNPIEMAFTKLKAILKKSSSANIAGPLACRRRHLQIVPPARMLELL